MRVFITLLLAALFHCGTALADPAVWSATRGESTLYLFGTLHMGDGSDKWRSHAVQNAFLQAGTVILETDTQARTDTIADLRKLGTNAPGIRLSDQISANIRPAFFSAIRRKQIPLAGIDRLRPWLAAVVLARGEALQNAPDPFIDRVIEEEARTYGKWLIYLERPADQYNRLAALSDRDASALLEESLLTSPAQNAKLVAAWQSGDIAKLDDLLNTARRRTRPGLADALIAEPNMRWADTLSRVAETDDIIFVAVGAAHMAGPGSLPEQMRRHGFQIERLNSQ